MQVIKQALDELFELRAQSFFLEVALTDKEKLILNEEELTGLVLIFQGMQSKYGKVEALLTKQLDQSAQAFSFSRPLASTSNDQIKCASCNSLVKIIITYLSLEP